MDRKEKPRFIQIMLGVADNFRDTITEQGMAMRFDMLKEYSIQQVEDAARQIMRNRKYTKMPPIAEFIEAIEGKPETRALEAWGMLMQGLTQGQVPRDPKINEIIKRIGGWDWLSRQGYDELHWIEKRFLEHFESMPRHYVPELPCGEAVGRLMDRVGKRIMDEREGKEVRI